MKNADIHGHSVNIMGSVNTPSRPIVVTPLSPKRSRQPSLLNLNQGQERVLIYRWNHPQ